MSPPFTIETPMPNASCPWKRIFGCGGSAYPRCTRAMSPRRKRRPFARIVVSRTASTESKSPVVRR